MYPFMNPYFRMRQYEAYYRNQCAYRQYQEWTSSKAYWGGEKVSYKGKDYEAKWWTQGDEPGKTVANEWETPWKLLTGGETPTEPGNGNGGGQTPPGGGNGGGTTPPDNNLPPDQAEYPDYSKVDVGKGIKWPEKVFAPFVDATGWPPLEFASMANELMVPYFNLGFVVAENNNSYKPSWGTYYAAGEGPLNGQIKMIREMGGDVIVSFGGVANVPVHVNAPNPEVLKEQYKRFIKAYGLTRIDFDIEGSWLQDKASNVRNSKALKMLQDELKEENYSLQIWFTLPVLPTGLTPDGLNVLRAALDEKVVIDGVNIMTMDYGDAVAPNPAGRMGEYGIQACDSLHGQLDILYKDYGMPKSNSELYAMIGTTPMIGMNDVTTEIFTIPDANQTLDYARTNSIGMISMWSLNRDKQCPQGKTNYVSITCSSIEQTPYQFSKTFNAYNDTSNFNPNAGGGGGTPPSNGGGNGGGQTPPGGGGTTEWDVNKTYVAGDEVTYDGKTYVAKWWTKGDLPTKEVNYPWETPWERVK